jgi:hypothetical protein
MTIGTEDRGGGLSGFGVAEEKETPLAGTGGAAGGGTRAGEGQPSGEGTVRDKDLPDGTTLAPAADVAAAGTLAGRSGDEAAKEAAALGTSGDHDKTPALEYGEGDRPRGPTMGEALGSGTGTHIGSGTREPPALGGAGPLGQEGGPGPAGTGSPGGNDAD